MSREKQIESSDWLTEGYSKEELARIKDKAIEEAEAELREKQIEDCAEDIAKLTEENERLNEYLYDHFPKCIYQYDGDVQEYCVLAPCGQFKTVAEFQKKIEADTVRKMQERLKERLADKPSLFTQQRYRVVDVIDQIAKELLEGEK